MKQRKSGWLLFPRILLGLFLCSSLPAANIGVRIVDFTFSPSNLALNAGDRVIWTNLSAQLLPHDSTHTNSAGPPLWGSPQLSVNLTFGFTLTNAGYYPYLCKTHVYATMVANRHPEQTGSISVVSFKLTSPTNSARFFSTAPVNIQATVSTNIAQARLFLGADLIAVVTNDPFALSTNLPAGAYSLSAIITDKLGRNLTNAGPNFFVVDPPKVTMESAQFLGDGRFQFNVSGGDPGQTCVIQASADLSIWSPVRTNTFPAPACLACPSIIVFADDQSPGLKQRFYKAQILP